MATSTVTLLNDGRLTVTDWRRDKSRPQIYVYKRCFRLYINSLLGYGKSGNTVLTQIDKSNLTSSKGIMQTLRYSHAQQIIRPTHKLWTRPGVGMFLLRIASGEEVLSGTSLFISICRLIKYGRLLRMLRKYGILKTGP